jgi:hypothetical protein
MAALRQAIDERVKLIAITHVPTIVAWSIPLPQSAR